MRNLQTQDVFAFLRIVKSMGIKEEFEKMALIVEGKKGIDPREVGIDLILNIIANASNKDAELKIYEFLGNILEKDAEEIRTQDPMLLYDDLLAFSELVDREKWLSFFKSVSSLIARLN